MNKEAATWTDGRVMVTTTDEALLKDVEMFLAVKGFVRHYRLFDHARRVWETTFVKPKVGP